MLLFKVKESEKTLGIPERVGGSLSKVDKSEWESMSSLELVLSKDLLIFADSDSLSEHPIVKKAKKLQIKPKRAENWLSATTLLV